MVVVLHVSRFSVVGPLRRWESALGSGVAWGKMAVPLEKLTGVGRFHAVRPSFCGTTLVCAAAVGAGTRAVGLRAEAVGSGFGGQCRGRAHSRRAGRKLRAPKQVRR